MKPKQKIIEKKPPIIFIALLLFLFFIAAYYNQWVTMEKLSEAIGPLSKFSSISNFFSFLNNYSQRLFDSTDSFFFNLLWIIPLIFFLMELKNKTLSKTALIFPKKDSSIIIMLIVIGLVWLRAYFAKGEDLYNGDSPYYYYLLQNMTWNFKRFSFAPFYTFMHGGGSPVNQFYGPLFSVAGAIFNIILNNSVLSAKITLFIFHILSAIGIYLFIKELTGSRRTAFFAGFAAIAVYLRLHLTIYPGRYGDASIWASYPFSFYFTEKLFQKRLFKYIFGFAVSIAFMIFGSIGHSYYFILFLGIYIFIRFLTLKKSWKEKLTSLLCIVTGTLLGILFSSYYLYSFLFESKWTVKEMFSSAKIGGREEGIILPLFLWNSHLFSIFNINIPWQTGYLGISLILTAIYGIIETIKKKKREFIPFIIMAIIFILFMAFYGSPFLTWIPFLHTYTQSRLLNIASFLTIVLFASGINIITNDTRKLIWILFIVFLDLFPTTFHDSAGRYYGGEARVLLKSLKKEYGIKNRKIADFRIDLLGSGDKNREINNNWRAYDAFMAETGIPILAETQWDYLPVKIFKEKIDESLYTSNDITYSMLLNYYRLMNVRYILSTIYLNTNFFKLKNKLRAVYLFEIENSPVFFTKNIIKIEEKKPDAVSFLKNLDIDMKSKFISYIETVNLKTNLISNASAQVIEHKTFLDRVNIKIESSDRIFAVLSYAAYPTLKIKINNKIVKPYETSYGFIVLSLEKGLSNIELLPARTFITKILVLLSFTVFILLLFLTVIIPKIKMKKEAM